MKESAEERVNHFALKLYNYSFMHVVSDESPYSSAGDMHLSYTDVPLYTSHAVKVLYVFNKPYCFYDKIQRTINCTIIQQQ